MLHLRSISPLSILFFVQLGIDEIIIQLGYISGTVVQLGYINVIAGISFQIVCMCFFFLSSVLLIRKLGMDIVSFVSIFPFLFHLHIVVLSNNKHSAWGKIRDGFFIKFFSFLVYFTIYVTCYNSNEWFVALFFISSYFLLLFLLRSIPPASSTMC